MVITDLLQPDAMFLLTGRTIKHCLRVAVLIDTGTLIRCVETVNNPIASLPNRDAVTRTLTLELIIGTWPLVVTVLFVTGVDTVVVTITVPSCMYALATCTLELCHAALPPHVGC
jgi:hypothetical protein